MPESPPVAAVELRGKMETLLTLAMGSADLAAVREALAAKVAQAPEFFAGSPVVLDLAMVADQIIDFEQLLAVLREHRLQPLAARHAGPDQCEAIAACGLPLLRDAPAGGASSASERAVQAEEQPADAVSTGTPMVISRPVRSGQQVYARGGDLILLGAASPGCELIADGSIHVYGPLRGRALCGVSGNGKSRIFCQNLEAELVSIAGHYKTLDELPASLRGQPAQVWLDDEKLHIEAID